MGLRNPAIELTPLRRVYVLGEVNRPGPYSVDPSISLSGVIAMAATSIFVTVLATFGR